MIFFLEIIEEEDKLDFFSKSPCCRLIFTKNGYLKNAYSMIIYNLAILKLGEKGLPDIVNIKNISSEGNRVILCRGLVLNCIETLCRGDRR